MPRKHIDPQKFTLKRNALNKTTVKAEKTAKPGSQWYYKHPNNVRSPENTLPNQHAYELEAIASDLFRFILGLSRAAKTRVVKSDSVEAVASQHNPAGYRTASPKEFEDNIMNDPGMVWALSVLNEGDLNPANFGVNDNNETAHIDFDLSLQRLKAKMYGATIGSIHGSMNTIPSDLLAALLPILERDEKDLQSEPTKIETRKKLFPILLKSLLLTPDVLDTISARHTELPLLREGLKTFMSEQLDPVDALLGSKALAEYLINTDFQQLEPELRQFFKFEQLNAREADRLLAAIEDRFISVKLLSFDKNPELLNRFVETPRSEEAQAKLLKNMRLLAATHSLENIPAVLHRLGKDHYTLSDFNDAKTLESYLPKIRQGDATQCRRVLGELYRETQAPDFTGDNQTSVLIKKNLLGHQLESNDFRAIKVTHYTVDTFADDPDLLKKYLTQYHQNDYEQYSVILKQLYEQAQQNNIPKDSSQYRLLSKLQQLDEYKQQRKGQAEYKHYHGYFFGYSKTEKLAAVKGGEEQLLGITAVLDKKQEQALNQGELKSRWNGPS
ncbi:hypothetical protein [Legionella quinlivanii]|uniref:hypothetical protein n=1 Tax=Legionella quinlivanii TaxID=45073 RepID=UPI002243BF7D|nr:hypothetical protein [Legionella quinlivanii]MCW8452404.1 hypothetical protein [Legionella quinlivanii]